MAAWATSCSKAFAFAEHLQKLAGLNRGDLQPAPDLESDVHPGATEELNKTLTPHLFGYDAGRFHCGCDPRQLASLKFQMHGDRFVAAMPFKPLLDHIVQEKVLDRVSYSSIRNWLMHNLGDDLIKQLRRGKVPISIV